MKEVDLSAKPKIGDYPSSDCADRSPGTQLKIDASGINLGVSWIFVFVVENGSGPGSVP